MNKILIVHLANALGLHFFDWTLNFLSDEPGVVSNPLIEKTAHAHSLKKVITENDLIRHQFGNSNNLILQTFLNTTAWDSLFTGDMSTHSGREKLKEFKVKHYIKIIKSAKEQEFQIILVDWAKQHWLIPSYQTRFILSVITGEKQTRNQFNDEWLIHYFPDTSNNWDNTSIWDKREMLGLSMRPETLCETFATVLASEFNNELDIVNTNELWFNMESVTAKYVDINKDKLQQWLPIYQQWQKIHDRYFSEDYWEILNAIQSGESKDLTSYNLDLTKESLIQHGMIYAYDLNFKTWQLEKFPNNTLELHQLLEPNIHSRDFTYNRQH